MLTRVSVLFRVPDMGARVHFNDTKESAGRLLAGVVLHPAPWKAFPMIVLTDLVCDAAWRGFLGGVERVPRNPDGRYFVIALTVGRVGTELAACRECVVVSICAGRVGGTPLGMSDEGPDVEAQRREGKHQVRRRTRTRGPTARMNRDPLN